MRPDSACKTRDHFIKTWELEERAKQAKLVGFGIQTLSACHTPPDALNPFCLHSNAGVVQSLLLPDTWSCQLYCVLATLMGVEWRLPVTLGLHVSGDEGQESLHLLLWHLCHFGDMSVRNSPAPLFSWETGFFGLKSDSSL